MVRRSILTIGVALGFYGASAHTAESAFIKLAATELSSSAEHRILLSYLVSCALPQGVTLYQEVDGQRVSFTGALGLAPTWLHRPLNEPEQRWVSACILARTNYFGKRVQISMRALEPAPGALAVTFAEQKEFTLYEGAFFGNLFQPEADAFTCSGPRLADQPLDPVLSDRICTERSTHTSADGQPLSHCGFIHQGLCPAMAAIQLDDVDYPEVIFIYLKPAMPAAPVKPES